MAERNGKRDSKLVGLLRKNLAEEGKTDKTKPKDRCFYLLEKKEQYFSDYMSGNVRFFFCSHILQTSFSLKIQLWNLGSVLLSGAQTRKRICTENW